MADLNYQVSTEDRETISDRCAISAHSAKHLTNTISYYRDVINSLASLSDINVVPMADILKPGAKKNCSKA